MAHFHVAFMFTSCMILEYLSMEKKVRQSLVFEIEDNLLTLSYDDQHNFISFKKNLCRSSSVGCMILQENYCPRLYVTFKDKTAQFHHFLA